MYNHQTKYAKAIGNLYRNRGPVQEHSPVDIKGVANTLGGNLMPVQQKPDNRMAQAIDYQTKQRDMGNAIMSAQMGDAIMRAQMQDAIQQGIMQQAKEQMARDRQAEAANLAPFDGKFSSTGYKDHVKQSQFQANDIQTSKQLMNGGMTLDQFMSSGMGGTRPRSPEEL